MPASQEGDQDEHQSTSWREVALLISMAIFVLVSIIVSMVSSLFMPSFDLTPQALATISGYYGPGSVAAWLVVALSNSEFIVLLKVFSKVITRRRFWSIDDLYGLKVDATIIGTFAYPIVAYVDLMLQIIGGLKSKGGPPTEQRIDAQLAVAHLSSAISIVALTAHYYFLLIYLLVKDDENFERTRPVPMMRKRRTRLAMWTTIFMFSQLWIALLGFQFRAKAISNLKHYSRLEIVMILVLTLLVPDGEIRGGSTKIAWLFCCMVFLLLFPSVNLDVGKEFGFRFPWPQSSARLSDLDQASALAVALSTTLASLAKWIARQLEARRTSDDEDNDDSADTKPSHSSAQNTVLPTSPSTN